MINLPSFYKSLKKNKIDFYVGVPDSLLKSFNSYIEEIVPKDKNIIAANEGNAISIATGYHLATKKIPFVYMQNSGLGNCINPLTSLTNKDTYQIPMILLIGWRGEPKYKDEPQHLMPGKILKKQLELLTIKYFLLDGKTCAKVLIDKAVKEAKKNSLPVALIVSKNTFSEDLIIKNKSVFNSSLSRYKSIECIVSHYKKDLIVSTTGKASRELFEIRKSGNGPMNDFLSVGSMGHVSSIAMGIAIGCKEKKIICIDGDGSLIMHMGSLGIIGNKKISNLKHFLINNGCHESVGGQITAGSTIEFSKIAKACGYSFVAKCKTIKQLERAIIKSHNYKGPIFIEIQVNNNSIKNLSRPNKSPIENKDNFVKFLNKRKK